MDERHDLEERIADLEAGLSSLAIRHSALEWIVEQHFAHYLLDRPRPDADAFLSGISHPTASPWQASEEGPTNVRPDHAKMLDAYIAHIAEKVRERVHQGIRRQ
ncbi:hypothetical protein [Brevundimonas diminuta]|uniref:hypothetical protein n=1 Tax=Brevundimonas diminuta TaxID=293 RepID=UPI0025A5FCEA|nr:hypothetical protein [Brevundimonas diminuta]MDM8352219.1 hypothetical protein [Brevundimonas diminuta]